MCSRYDLSKSSVIVLLPTYDKKTRLHINLNRSIINTGGVSMFTGFPARFGSSKCGVGCSFTNRGLYFI